ncbi:phosphate signaling complex protein PhoU [Levilactobacillus bambusae]|uniref:Phosphate-specific transport system accessory protein PhoU n=1 Tax=Levilactobacillus bambusae TaxID=2024736 RepID=A0A2V1MY29_9LACO|nr:phosphate signaling complex protein PhoU [Levilactobacillus bambusae]PWF99427.1 phosphate transport system regulatory protein PhoU [Levilactobacillus bambusae]
MRRLFDDELEELDSDFTEMGLLVADRISAAVTAFTDRDTQLADRVINHDHEVNEREIALEQKSFEMIALYQPVTTDLREIVTILKAVSDLERAADHARNIAHAALKVTDKERIPELEALINQMGTKTTQMIRDVLTAYTSVDEDRAKQIAQIGQELDELNHDARNLSYEHMKSDPEFKTAASIYVNVAQDLDRIGDYVTNVCEWIIYLKSGRIVELD